MPEFRERAEGMAAAARRLITGNSSSSSFVRFILAGGLNTLFGFGIYAAAILGGAAVWLALLFGVLAGIVFNFFTIGGYAFRQLSAGRFPRFVICYLLIYGINLGLIKFLSQWVQGAIVIQFVLLFPMAATSYLLMRSFVFSAPQSALQE